MKKIWIMKIGGFIILINALPILHFLLFPFSIETPPPSPLNVFERFPEGYGRPWPLVSSFRPWVANPNLPPFSCEGYFGHGFNDFHEVLKVDLGKVIASRRSYQVQRDMKEANDLTWSKFRYRKNGAYNDTFLSELLHQIKKSTAKGTEGQRPFGGFQCVYSDTLKTSICRGANVVMHPERIEMSNGGEPVDSVLGRTDEEELPSFTIGAFEIQVPVDGSIKAGNRVFSQELLDSLAPQNHIGYHTMRILFDNMRTVRSDQLGCSQVIVEPTLIVTRFEYANLFHTLTDWYSSYVAARVLGLSRRPNVILLDGHCQSPMDDAWSSLFSNVTYAKHFTGPVCLDNAIFAPLGYETALFKGLSSGIPCYGCSAVELERNFDHGKTARLHEFGEFFKAAFELTDISLPHDKRDIKVLFIRRENYLAHPRHKGRPETRLSNEQELFVSLMSWAEAQSQHNKGVIVSILNGTLAHMRMKEQVQAVNVASVIIGAHGAGLSHIVFARPGTKIVELLAPQFRRPHYAHISQWMGLEYHSIDMPSTIVNCAQVTELLTVILRRSLQTTKD